MLEWEGRCTQDFGWETLRNKTAGRYGHRLVILELWVMNNRGFCGGCKF